MVQEKNKLFGASFEQSKRIVPRSFATEDGAQMGVSVSMSFWKRVFGLVGLMFSFIAYGAGIYLTDGFRSSTDSVQVISKSTGALIGEVGLYFRPINLVLVILFTAIIILNILPKINYAYQLIYGNCLLIMFGLVTIFSGLPLLIGLTIGALGTLAFIVQLIFFGYLVKKLIVDVMKEVKTSLYNEKEIIIKSNNKEYKYIFENELKEYIKKNENKNDNSPVSFVLGDYEGLLFSDIYYNKVKGKSPLYYDIQSEYSATILLKKR